MFTIPGGQPIREKGGPLRPLGSECAQHRRTGFLSDRIVGSPGSSPAVQKAGAEGLKVGLQSGIWVPPSPLGPLGFEGAEDRQTLRPSVFAYHFALPCLPKSPFFDVVRQVDF